MTPTRKSRKVPLMSEYEKLEIQEVFDRTKTYTILRIQIYSFFGTVNITFLGIGVSMKRAGIFIASAFMIALLALVDSGMARRQRYYYERGLELEGKFSPDPEIAILRSFLSKSRFLSVSGINWLTISIICVEILLTFISWYFFKWSLF